ncbi:MAG TPA: hypothetical protein VHD31_03345 [Candidatus Paceibacterota bacterium]|nr:hypothetical protein [Candidatus Paceibacterota bacterium]
MQAYIEKLKAEKSTHERRQIALRVAGTVTAVMFVVWISTLGVRLAGSGSQQPTNTANTAATLQAVQAASSSNQTLIPGY